MAHLLFYLLLDLAIIIVAARLMGSLARRVGQPAVVGEILAGILLGPTVLGRISPELPAHLFPPEVPLKAFADLGLVLFMFLVGLELDTKLIRSQGSRPAIVSLSGVLFPALLGVGVGLALFQVNDSGLQGELRPDRLTFALFLGAAMCITAFPILARILVESGMYKTAVGTLALCAAAVDDVLAWILLATVVGIIQSGSPIEAARAFALAAVFVLFMFLVVRRLLERVARRHAATGKLTLDQVAIIVVGVLLSAMATEYIGIHSIFGAFVFGSIMPKPSKMTHELTDKLEDFTVIVLLPIFFLVTGLRTNLLTLNSASLLGWLLLIVAAATAGKFLGCGIATKLTGAPFRESVIVGTLMNTRGLTELVILTIGLNLGVLSDQTFAMMVIMALVTTVMAAPIVNRLMPRDSFIQAIGRPDQVATAATRVLVGIGSPQSALPAVDIALRIIGARRPAEVLLVHLLPTPRSSEIRSGLQSGGAESAPAADAMRRLVGRLKASGIQARPISFLSEDIAKDLVRLASDQQCDLILAQESISGEPGGLPRTVIDRMIERAAVRLVILPDQPIGRGTAGRDDPVIAVLTGGPGHEPTVDVALSLAAGSDAPLELTWLPDDTDLSPAEVSRELALLVDSLRDRSEHGVTAAYFGDEPWLELGRRSAATVALVVETTTLDRSGRTWSAIDALIAQAECPVLVVPPSPASASSPTAEQWPFIIPDQPRPPGAQPLVVSDEPTIQRLDPWGVPIEALVVGEALPIGRAPDNRLALLDDPLVSRSHAQVVASGGGYSIRDIQSTNGTTLWRSGEWRRVDSEALEDGDFIIVGSNVLRFLNPVKQGDA